MRPRHTFVATSLVALLAVGGVTAAIAASRAPAPPPRIAFLANGIVPADALAAGPIAGQLGAPVFTTRQEELPSGTATALTAYNPELVIVMGGPVAISDAVVHQISSVTGLPIVDPTPTPATGVVRAAGGDRFETATIVAGLLGAYAPAYLPVDLQAVDADLLDGKDASEFASSSHDHRSAVERTYVCSGVDFKPLRSSQEWRHQNHSFVPLGATTNFSLCPLHLPDGAVLNTVSVALRDTHATGRWSNVSVWRSTPSTGTEVASMADPLGANNAATPGNGQADLTDLDEAIDNSTHTYVVAVQHSTTANEDGGLQLGRAVVTYTVTDSPMGGE